MIRRALIAFALFGSVSAWTEPYERVILISIDTLRADHVGSYGYVRDTTPFIDSLAGRGLRFTRYHTNIATTMPSHATMLTSLYPSQHQLRANGMRMSDDAITVPERLKEGGIESALFTAVSFAFVPGNIAQGFAIASEPTFLDEWQGLYDPADGVVDRAIEYVSSKPADARFFLLVHLFDPHDPYRPPKDYVEMVASERTLEEKRALALHWLNVQHKEPDVFENGVYQLAATMDQYDAEVRFADAQLARLYESFEARGLNDGALWIVTADHGEGLSTHGWMSHGKHIYEEQAHVICVLHDPARTAAATSDALAGHIDLAPTILEALGCEPGAMPAMGRSLLPMLREGAPFERDAFFVERRTFKESERPSERDAKSEEYEAGERYAVVTDRYKFFRVTAGTDELYDLVNDPYEQRNLIGTGISEEALLRDRLESLLNEASTTHQLPSVDHVLDDESRETLEALGYIE